MQEPQANDSGSSGGQLSGTGGTERFEVLRPERPWELFNLRELWRYRELAMVLAVRDLKVRYKQTIVGALWAVMRPLIVMVVFTLFFRLLGRTPASGDVPYAITLYTALLPWQLFAGVVDGASGSIVANKDLVRKIFFPRIILPAVPIVTGLVDFFIAMLVLFAMMFYYGIAPGWPILTIPFFMGMAVLTALAIGLWISATNALFRDFGYVVPFLVQIGFYLTPVMYETQSIIPSQWQLVFSLNPMAGVIEGFRWAVLGYAHPPATIMLCSLAMVVTLLLTGAYYFKRLERVFVDWI